MSTIHGRTMVVSYSIEDDGTHVCLLTYQDENQDDERELWKGIGIDHKTACDAVWRAYWKWRDSTDPDQTPRRGDHEPHGWDALRDC